MRELRRLHELERYALHARDGDIGRLRQVYFDDRDWRVRYLVVRSGNWLLGRDVLLLPGMVTSTDHERQRIDIDLTREQIEHAPPVQAQTPVSRHYEQEFYRHYDWEPYWGGDPFLGLGDQFPLSLDDEPSREPVNPHLRSSDEVKGYRIGAADGEIGEVRDFILDAAGWRIRYLDVATGRWLLGRDVLVACPWLDAIDWSTQTVTTSLARNAIEGAPSYDANKVIGHHYEVALYSHYGRHFEEDD